MHHQLFLTFGPHPTLKNGDDIYGRPFLKNGDVMYGQPFKELFFYKVVDPVKSQIYPNFIRDLKEHKLAKI
jgi:hypothetical protein